MLSPTPQHHGFHFSPHLSIAPPVCRSCTSFTVLNSRISHHLTISSCYRDNRRTNPGHEIHVAVPDGGDETLFRRHNAKSTALLLRQISSAEETTIADDEFHPQEYGEMPEEDKTRILEMSMVQKRIPQFPGSIYIQSSSDGDMNSSLPPIQSLLRDGENDKMLLKALEIRRNVTVEIFKEAMIKNGKFGITYSTNLISLSPEFIDCVMIKAASMKRLPEFEHSTFNERARKVIYESDVVSVIRWLKHNGLSYPQIAKLLCLSKGNAYSIRSVVEWIKSIHVQGRYIGVALTKAGENILERSTEELDEIVGYLESKGVKSEWMGYVISRCPQLLSFNLEELKTRAEFYLDMAMNDKDFGTMIFDFPKVLGFFSMEEMKQKVDYLMEFGLSKEDVGRLLAFRPQLMACSIEERWKPLVKYLYYLGITRDGMRRMLTIKPIIFCVDFETTIVPKVQFLREIGVQQGAIGNMLVKFPPLLTYSLHKKIRPVVIFLLTKAGVDQKDIGKVIGLGPELLGCSIHRKLDVSVKYFLSLGIYPRVLGAMIADFPILLRYNIDILRPKYRYLRRDMVRPLKDLIEFPRFFSYSLEGRIIPRHKIMVENRVNFKLRYMLSDSDEEFEQRVQAAVERRKKFEMGILIEKTSDEASEFTVDCTENEYPTSDTETIEASSSESIQFHESNVLPL